jgi:Ankyrin repeats (3 copies)
MISVWKRQVATPLWLAPLWLISLLAAVTIEARLTWERTMWTWERGPQMVGYSLVHGEPGLFMVGILGFLGAIGFTLFFLACLIWRSIKKKQPKAGLFCLLLITASPLVLESIPYHRWQALMLSVRGESEKLKWNDVLEHAALQGDFAAAKALVAKMPDGDQKKATIARLIRISKGTELSSWLLEQGADVNDQSEEFRTSPLMLAASNGWDEKVQWLIQHRAKVDLQDKVGGTALMMSVPGGTNGSAECFRLLLAAGADLSIRDQEGRTAIDILAKSFPEKEKARVLSYLKDHETNGSKK